jgi:hypothetical protein
MEEMAGMEFLSELQAVPCPQVTTKIDDTLKSVVPAQFVDDKATESEVPRRAPCKSDIATFIDVKQIHGGASCAAPQNKG